MIEKLGIAAISAIFGAGVAWGMLKTLERHVNGLGRKVNAMRDAMLTYWPEDSRKDVAKFLHR